MVFNPNVPPDPMRISLDLSRRCIETELRRRHERAVADALRPGADLEAAAHRIGLLRSALRGLDFSRLRADFPDLNAGGTAAVALDARPEDKRLRLTVDDAVVADAPLGEVS